MKALRVMQGLRLWAFVSAERVLVSVRSSGALRRFGMEDFS